MVSTEQTNLLMSSCVKFSITFGSGLRGFFFLAAFVLDFLALGAGRVTAVLLLAVVASEVGSAASSAKSPGSASAGAEAPAAFASSPSTRTGFSSDPVNSSTTR